MKASEFRARSSAELLEQLVTLRREQFNLRVQRAAGQQARSDQISRVRRDIARLKTVLSEQQLRDAPAGARR